MAMTPTTPIRPRTAQRSRWGNPAREHSAAMARLDALARELMAQAERVDALVRDLWDVPSAYGELLVTASGKLLDSACELAEVRDRLARYERLAG